MYGRGGPGFPTHGSVFEQFLQDREDQGIVNLQFFKCRGGWIVIHKDTTKIVRVGGESGDYGKYDSLIVKTLLTTYVQKKIPGFTLIVTA